MCILPQKHIYIDDVFPLPAKKYLRPELHHLCQKNWLFSNQPTLDSTSFHVTCLSMADLTTDRKYMDVTLAID